MMKDGGFLMADKDHKNDRAVFASGFGYFTHPDRFEDDPQGRVYNGRPVKLVNGQPFTVVSANETFRTNAKDFDPGYLF